MKIDTVEFLREQASTAEDGGMPIRVSKYTQAAAEIERLRYELRECLEDRFFEIANYDAKQDRWCTDGITTAVNAGDRLVELGGWQHLEGGYGRVKFYRPIPTTPPPARGER